MHDSALASTVISIRYQLFERKVGKGMGVFYIDLYHFFGNNYNFDINSVF